MEGLVFESAPEHPRKREMDNAGHGAVSRALLVP
jgi:hypothetical protein